MGKSSTMNILIQRTLAVLIFLLVFPLFLIVWLSVRVLGKDMLIFKQKRVGYKRKPFTIFKIRTMEKGAEDKKKKFMSLNEASPPAFKIYDDPRYTKIGKVLAHSGLDELPQIVNIIRGEMLFVGPRPLPVDEGKKIPQKYLKRFTVLPGITSLWVIEGAHELTFDEWMKLDLEYVDKKSFLLDLKIILITIFIMLRGLVVKK